MHTSLFFLPLVLDFIAANLLRNSQSTTRVSSKFGLAIAEGSGTSTLGVRMFTFIGDLVERLQGKGRAFVLPFLSLQPWVQCQDMVLVVTD